MNNKDEKKSSNFLNDNRAVSPMIATIMLIAVVVILGAVIGASSMKSASKMDTTTNAVSWQLHKPALVYTTLR